MTGFAQPGHGFEPAVDLFYAFALLLTEGIAGMASGARIDDAGRLAREVRRDLMLAQLQDKLLAVIALVRAQRHPLPALDSFHQRDRRFNFRTTRGWGYAAVDRQPIAIFHQHVARITELGFLARPLAGQPGGGIGGGLVRIVAAPFAVEVDARVAGIVIGRRLQCSEC